MLQSVTGQFLWIWKLKIYKVDFVHVKHRQNITFSKLTSIKNLPHWNVWDWPISLCRILSLGKQNWLYLLLFLYLPGKIPWQSLIFLLCSIQYDQCAIILELGLCTLKCFFQKQEDVKFWTRNALSKLKDLQAYQENYFVYQEDRINQEKMKNFPHSYFNRINRSKQVSMPPGKAMRGSLQLEPKYQLLHTVPNIAPAGWASAEGGQQSQTPDSPVTGAPLLLVVETNALKIWAENKSH